MNDIIACDVELGIRPIPGFPGYVASSDGTIWSNKKYRGRLGWRKLTPKLDKDGYLELGLRRDGKSHLFKVHQLIAISFIGPRPDGHQVCHGDNCRTNNVPENLRYGTVLENQRDRRKHGTAPIGEKHPRAKLTENDIREIRRLAPDLSRKEIAARFSTTPGYVVRIIGRNVWSHV